MPPRTVRWDRLFGIYVAIIALCLVTGIATPPPLHDIFLTIAVILFAAFVPLIMAIYFLRGLRGNIRPASMPPQ